MALASPGASVSAGAAASGAATRGRALTATTTPRPAAGAAAAAATTTTSKNSMNFRVKWFVDDETRPPVAICLQGHSGPCPLLALANTLLLRRTLVMPENLHVISDEHLLGLLTDLPAATSTDVLEVLPNLAHSVAVDVCFSGTTEFASSAELGVFDTFRIRVLHGWIPDPHDDLLSGCISPLSYNQVCDQLVYAASSPVSEADFTSPGSPTGAAEAALDRITLDPPVDHEPHRLPVIAQAPAATSAVLDNVAGMPPIDSSSPASVLPSAPPLPAHVDVEEQSIYALPGLFDDDHSHYAPEDGESAKGTPITEHREDNAAQRPESAGLAEPAAAEQAPESSRTVVSSPDKPPSVADNALIVQAFLQDTSTMLTHFGLIALHDTLYEREYAVLFLNNHFSVLTKHDGHLYMLVTDAGYSSQPSVIWERLSDVDGNTTFFNALFHPASVRIASSAPARADPPAPRPNALPHPVAAGSSQRPPAQAASSSAASRPATRPPAANAVSKRNSGRKYEKGSKGCIVQ